MGQTCGADLKSQIAKILGQTCGADLKSQTAKILGQTCGADLKSQTAKILGQTCGADLKSAISFLLMPIIRQWPVFDDCEIALWQLNETEADLQKNLIATPGEWNEYETISHPQKRREWLAGRQTARALVESKGLVYSGLEKDEFGKPHLLSANAELSLTHTAAYVAAAICPNYAVGLDLEKVAEKLARIAPKFLSESEARHANGNLARICTYWCAKEALYKRHGTRQLRFREDIPIDEFADDTLFFTGNIQHQKYHLHRFWVADFCGVLAGRLVLDL